MSLIFSHRQVTVFHCLISAVVWVFPCSLSFVIIILYYAQVGAEYIKQNNKKVRYPEEHSASVVLSWCTL